MAFDRQKRRFLVDKDPGDSYEDDGAPTGQLVDSEEAQDQ